MIDGVDDGDLLDVLRELRDLARLQIEATEVATRTTRRAARAVTWPGALALVVVVLVVVVIVGRWVVGRGAADRAEQDRARVEQYEADVASCVRGNEFRAQSIETWRSGLVATGAVIAGRFAENEAEAAELREAFRLVADEVADGLADEPAYAPRDCDAIPAPG